MRVTTLIFPFFFNDPATTEIYTLSLHDALPIFAQLDPLRWRLLDSDDEPPGPGEQRSEEHTSERQSHLNIVCRLLLEKKHQTTRPSYPGSRQRKNAQENRAPTTI